jgi:nucleoside-diphosphate-sugar epimerase
MSGISIIGCGWLGLPLGTALAESGYTVKGSTTTESKLATIAEHEIIPVLADFSKDVNQEALVQLTHCDVAIITVPFSRKKTAEENKALYKRIAGTLSLEGVERVIMISSTSVYDDESGVYTESDALETHPIRECERYFLDQFPSALVIRFSGLIGPMRHPGKFLAGRKNLPGPLHPVHLIHQADCIGLIAHCIEHRIEDTLNACMPDSMSRKEFYTQAAFDLGLEPPHFDESDLSNGRIISIARLVEEVKYTFQYTTLQQALAHC